MAKTPTDRSFGKRVRDLRDITGLSRRAFSENHSIPEPTLRSWELAVSEISGRMQLKLLSAFAAEGIHTSMAWIIKGEGKQLLPPPKNIQLNNTDFSTIVLDDTHAPYCTQGDQLHGTEISPDDLPQNTSQLCIIKEKGKRDPHITLVTQDIHHNLHAIHPRTLSVSPLLKEKIEAIYLCTWIKKTV